jgi:DNA-directed RNA polymerase specialized sigma24 family protein
VSASTKFADAAKRINSALARRDDAAVTSADHALVLQTLERILFVRYRALGPDEIFDTASEAVARLLRESRRRGVPLDNPAGWLRTVAGNIAKEKLEDLGHFADSDEEPADEDETLSVISRLGDQDAFVRALELAIADRDETTVRIVTDWIDLEEELGRSPSSRQVGEKTGYSHTTVNQALSRFGEYLTEVGEKGAPLG